MDLRTGAGHRLQRSDIEALAAGIANEDTFHGNPAPGLTLRMEYRRTQ